MIGTHYNCPPNTDNVQTLVDLLGKPRYRNSLREIVPFEATVIRQVKAVGSSGWPWIEEDYAEVSLLTDNSVWDKDTNRYVEAHVPFPLPKTAAGQKKILRELKVDSSSLEAYFSWQYHRRSFFPTMDALFAAIGIPAPTWPEKPYGSWIDDSVDIPELSLKFNLWTGDLKLTELQEERGNYRYSKEDIAEALAQHFHSAVTLPLLPEEKLPVIYTNYCPGSGIREP